MNNGPFAEILQSDPFCFLGQSWQWDHTPALGDLVNVQEPWGTRYALIIHVQTGSCEAGRMPIAYQKTHEQLKQEQPHIYEFLTTTFRCINVGFLKKTELFYQPAPKPALIHSFIRLANQSEWETFFLHTHYIRTIFSLSNHISNLDELILSVCRLQKERNILDQQKITAIAHTLLDLFCEDYRRLRNFLVRADQILSDPLVAQESNPYS